MPLEPSGGTHAVRMALEESAAGSGESAPKRAKITRYVEVKEGDGVLLIDLNHDACCGHILNDVCEREKLNVKQSHLKLYKSKAAYTNFIYGVDVETNKASP